MIQNGIRIVPYCGQKEGRTDFRRLPSNNFPPRLPA